MHNSKIDAITKKYYQAARSVGPLPNPASSIEIDWINLSGLGIQWSKKRESPKDDFPLLKKYIEWVEQKSITKGHWAIFIAHEVLPFSQIKEYINRIASGSGEFTDQ